MTGMETLPGQVAFMDHKELVSCIAPLKVPRNGAEGLKIDYREIDKCGRGALTGFQYFTVLQIDLSISVYRG